VLAASEVALEWPPLLVLGVGVLDADPCSDDCWWRCASYSAVSSEDASFFGLSGGAAHHR